MAKLPQMPFSQAVLDSMSAHIAVLDRNGTILTVNAAWERFGREHGRAIDPALERIDVGANYLAVCRAGADAGSADAQAAYDGIRDVLHGQRASFMLEYRCNGPHTTAWYMLSATPLEKHAVVVVAHADMTAHRQAEADLEVSERRFQQLAESLPQLVWACLPDGQCDYLSPQWLDYTGVPETALLGLGWLEQVHPAEQPATRAAWNAAVAAGAIFERDFRMCQAGGAYCWFKARAVPFRDPAGQIVKWFGTCTDIEAQKQAEAQLRAQTARLMELSVRLVNAQEDERRTLAYELHDEIGQQLTGLNMVLESGTNTSIALLRAKLHDAQRLVANLTTQIRQLSLDLRPPMLDDMGLLPTLLWHIQRYTQQTNVMVDFKYSGLSVALPPHVAIAAYRIVQEGLTNVARHAQTTAAAVRVWINAGQLKITLEDQGCGFDMAGAPQDGRSIGLAGMRERAQLLGGQFNFDSAPGEGTRIRVTLPIGTVEGR
jgi:PAS domain S-box-containing protein